MPDLTPGAPATPARVALALTDGTGISQLLASKIVKDLVLDFILTSGAALVALNITDVRAAVLAPAVAATALIDAAIRVVARAVIRWATSP